MGQPHPAWLLCSLGVVTGLVNAYYWIQSPGLPLGETLIVFVVPLAVAGVHVGLGWLLAHNTSAEATHRVLGWAAIGSTVVGTLVAADLTTTAGWAAGRTAVDVSTIPISESAFAAGIYLWNGAARGALFGALIGLYDVQRIEAAAARRELERKNERLDSFAGTVTHDIRNPLTVASGYLEIARENRSEGDEELQRVEEALGRIERIVDDALSLARGDGRIEESEPASLRSLAESAWSVTEPQRATLVVEEDVTMECDPERVQRLLENLFRNVEEHAVDGVEGQVTVRVHPTADGFEVVDDGPGFPPSVREAFSGATSAPRPHRTGLGLAIVAEIADAHGWEVSMGNAADGGARVVFGAVDVTAGS